MLASPRSLRRQLLIWMLAPQLVLWLAGALFTYNLAARYANEAIDASLLQSLRSLARQVKPIGNGLFIDFPRAAQDILEADPKDRVLYMVSTPPGEFILGNRNLPAPPNGAAALGVPQVYDSQLAVDGLGRQNSTEPIRVAAIYLSYGDELGPMQTMLVQVARSSANREQVARRILEDTVLPLSALMLLLATVVAAGIRAGLAPLSRLRNLVAGRHADDLTPIELETAPEEVRALAEAINRLLGTVQRSLAAQKRFISDAAHQLRTPLAGLKSQTELALAESSSPEQRTRLQMVHDSATRSSHLVAQLLTLARAEPESATRQAHNLFDLAALAREVTAEWVPRTLQAGVDLGFGTESDTDQDPDDAARVRVRGIPLLIREVLTNLIDNATRYAGRGARVTVRVYAAPPWAVLVVEDDGPGLPDSARELVFERFVRFSPDTQGCGLGLAIVKEIVERHAGRVYLQTALPHGLRVIVNLPLGAADAPTVNLKEAGPG